MKVNECKNTTHRRATIEERAMQVDCSYCDTAKARDGNFCPRCGKPLRDSEFFTFDSLKD